MERKEKERQKIEQEKRKEKEEEDALEQVSYTPHPMNQILKFLFSPGKASYVVADLSIIVNVNTSSCSTIIILVITILSPILPTLLAATFSINSYPTSVSKSRYKDCQLSCFSISSSLC